MAIYLFLSQSNENVQGFTLDITGSNLPADYAPWHAAGSGEAVPVGGDTDPVAMIVQRDGYFLVSTRKRSPGQVTNTSRPLR